MLKSAFAIAALYCLSINAPACFADEVTSSTVKTSTPAGSASSTVRSSVGPAGASITTEKNSVGPNGLGGITTSQHKESNNIDAAGQSSRHVSHSATMVQPDGSTATIKKESDTISP